MKKMILVSLILVFGIGLFTMDSRYPAGHYHSSCGGFIHLGAINGTERMVDIRDSNNRTIAAGFVETFARNSNFMIYDINGKFIGSLRMVNNNTIRFVLPNQQVVGDYTIRR